MDEHTALQYRRESDRRLDRIEEKLDQVAEALQVLARTEEKLFSISGRVTSIERKMEVGYQEHLKLLEAAKDSHVTSMMVDRIIMRLDHMEDTLNQLTVRMASNDTTTNDLKKVWGVIVAAAIGAAFYLWRG